MLQDTQFAYDAVAATVQAGPAGSRPERVALDAERIRELERLDRCVERVRHCDVEAARPIRVRTSPLTAADRLVVREALVAEDDVVHGALPLRQIERAEEHIDDPRGRL